MVVKSTYSEQKLIKEIEKVGFTLNPSKTSMQFKNSRQMASGLIVNEKVNIKREYYKTARSMCHELFNTGEFYLNNKDDSLDDIHNKEGKGTINQLEGILSFIYKIKRPHDTAKLGNRRFHPNAITKLYRDFLFYKHFYAMQKPVIVCEGKTDIIYLKCALKQLKEEYHDFIEIKEDIADYKISFLNFTNNLKDVFAISTGTSGLNHLMEIYGLNIGKFNVSGKQFPVVVIIDNDDGADEIKKKLKINNNEEIKEFYHFVENLYVLIIPKDEGKAIEDFFEPDILNTKIDGKVFNRHKKIDTNKEYGKIVFAEKVVKGNQQNINFNGFKEVFDKLREAIHDYDKKSV